MLQPVHLHFTVAFTSLLDPIPLLATSICTSHRPLNGAIGQVVSGNDKIITETKVVGN